VRDQPPHVVLKDLSMPETNGCEITRWLQSGTQPRLPVIALTAWARPENAAGARDAGCTAVCVKRCLPDVLAATIRAVMGTPGVRA
jgi:DNA-binding NarL/FixJ family response regulator